MELRTRVSLRTGDRSLDVVLPHHTPVYEALRSAGLEMSDPSSVLLDSSGRPVDPYATDGQSLTDGTVLHVVGRLPGVPGSGAQGPTGTRPADPGTARPVDG
ncbi:ubiquitin family protein, partial [Cellulomonas bogoriensis]|uniref:hypothetical protein n=1 Tax=Cellulomonas bogoriensis TaxID=301388 RepID=UPI000552AB6A